MVCRRLCIHTSAGYEAYSLYFPGGHLKPDPYSRAAGILKTHGKAVAEHVASFEARQVKEVKEFVERESIDCDFEETKVVDVCFYETGRDKVKSDLARLAEADISTVRAVEFYSGAESGKVCAPISTIRRSSRYELTLTLQAGLGRQRLRILPCLQCRTTMAVPTCGSYIRTSGRSRSKPADQHPCNERLAWARTIRNSYLDSQHPTRTINMQDHHPRNQRIRKCSRTRTPNQNRSRQGHSRTTCTE
jgi:hypothetical protein